MVQRQCAGVLPEPGAFTEADQAILAQADGIIGQAREHMKTQQLHQVLNVIWSVVGEANRYFAGEAPWAAAKTDPERMRTILYVTAEVLRQVGILVQPVMPEAAAKLLDLLGVPAEERSFASLGPTGRLVPGTPLPPPQPIFPRYVEAESEATE
jgi:methionyl-tRNA synthetase